VQSTYSPAVEEQLLLSKAAFSLSGDLELASYVQVRGRQNLLLFQEFAAEIGGILRVQRTLGLARDLV